MPFPALSVSIGGFVLFLFCFSQKLMRQMNSKNKEEVEEETIELDVSDEEMARR